MAKLIFKEKDMMTNNKDKATKAELKKALKSGKEVICADWYPNDYPFILQDVIRRRQGVVETYSFDKCKSQADDRFHLKPTSKVGAPDKLTRAAILDNILNFMLASYDLFIINSANEFIYEKRLMTVNSTDYGVLGLGEMY